MASVYNVLQLCALVVWLPASAIKGASATAPHAHFGLNSMLILQDISESPPSSSCVAMQLAPTYLLTSASCDATSKTARLLSTQASPNTTKVQSTWSLSVTDPAIDIRNASVAVGPTYRIVELREPITHASRSSVSLPVGMTLPPTPQLDENGTLLLVDLERMELKVARRVIFINKTNCESVASGGTERANGQTACVVAGRGEDRNLDESQNSWSFLMHHHGSSDAMLIIGLGAPSDRRGADWHLVSWLPTAMAGDHVSGLRGRMGINVLDLTEESRMLGGSLVPRIDKYKQFVVGLRKQPYDDNGCTGSLITSKFVLTAAHCGKPGSEFEWAVIGATQVSGDHGEIIRIRKRTRHPDYIPKTLTSDIMIVELVRRSWQKPVQINTGDFVTLKGTILGYGQTNAFTNGPASDLRSLPMSIGPSNAKCEKEMSVDLDETKLCGGGEVGKGSCYGDSGGPLLVFAGTDDQRVIAVISSGIKCGVNGQYTFFSRVSKAADFIKETTTVVEPTPRPRLSSTPPRAITFQALARMDDKDDDDDDCEHVASSPP